MGKSKVSNQKKARTASSRVAEGAFGSVPHSFVFHRGQIGRNAAQLVTDMRRVMEPYTARSLKVRKKNVLKDFVTVAGPLGVSHFLIFTKTPNSINLRLARLPKGPTLHFRVTKYSLIKDVISSLKRHRMHGQQFTYHPLLVLNNFGIEGMHVKLTATMFQNMFPSINVHQVNLNNIKRCVLVNYDPASQEIEFRHYSLKVVPVGMSRGVKKIIQEKFPNMNKLEDISDLLLRGVNLSESEAEQDGEHNITELPQVYAGRGNMQSQQSAVRLTEIGPRMTLQLVKIVEGMGEGNVIYHSTITKTEEELQEILKRKEARLKEKAERRRTQEHNIALKKEKREDSRKKSLEGMKRKRQQAEVVSDEEDEADPKSAGKSTFGAKCPAGRRLGGKRISRFSVRSKGFGGRKMGEAEKRFDRSKAGKTFGGNQKERSRGKNTGPQTSKIKGQRSKMGSGFKAGPRSGRAKQSSKQKGKR
uniref:Brix domain-containing protein n=1 Tax=Electrophorus electricus TaxID=8005 RepID=A0AAY5EG84_ELEEL